MGKIADACIDTDRKWVLYRDFIIAEAYDRNTRRDVWEWAHKNYNVLTRCVKGDSHTLFEAIDAIDAWHEANDAGRTEAKEGGQPCSDCPPSNYPTDKTRCAPCPHRSAPTDAGQTAPQEN